MSIYEKFREDAIVAEGHVLHVYRDSLGIPTGGIGHRLVGNELEDYPVNTALTEEQVETWFEQDYRKALMGIAKHFHDWNDYPQLAKLAMLNWCFQLGQNAPEKFPRATKALQERDWATAADEWEFSDPKTMRKSKWMHQTPARCLQEIHRLRELAE